MLVPSATVLAASLAFAGGGARPRGSDGAGAGTCRPTRLAGAVVVALSLLGGMGASRVRPVAGEVLGLHDQPVAGAKVTLLPNAAGAPLTTTSGEDGRWSLPAVPVGRWRVELAAAGYEDTFGWIDVGRRPEAPVRVHLLPLGATVKGMLAEGQRLLAAGDYAGAELQLERALSALPPEQQPPVLAEQAHAYFLAGDIAEALRRLRRALLLAPGDAIAGALFTDLMEQDGRAEEARRWLARLAAEGPAGLAAEEQGWDPPRYEQRPPTARGRFTTVLAERLPASSVAEYCRRHGVDRRTVAEHGGDYRLGEETFEVYVPPSCAAQTPCGLFVWISPSPWGGIPDRDIVPVLDERRLIWIGANRSGNERVRWHREGLALDAVHGIAAAHRVDPARTYVGGYSGGGRLASSLSVLYPEVFSGGLFYMGANFYRSLPNANRPGTSWPAFFPPPPRHALERARRHRFAFVTGEYDFNRVEVGTVYEAYRGDGFERVRRVELPGVTHFDGFMRAAFVAGIELVDAEAPSATQSRSHGRPSTR